MRGGISSDFESSSTRSHDVSRNPRRDVAAVSRDDRERLELTYWHESERVTEVVGLLRVWIRIKIICETTQKYETCYRYCLGNKPILTAPPPGVRRKEPNSKSPHD